MAVFAHEYPDAQGKSAPAARELVKIIVPEFRFCIDGRTILVNSVDALTLISICFYHSPASVIWKGIKNIDGTKLASDLVGALISINFEREPNSQPTSSTKRYKSDSLQTSPTTPTTFTFGKDFESS
ncbi:hypothetical protein BOTCAL_0143g00130 [Botryotinia calthae]|uniref:Uncharacterized protein n=1 Tax=Botryotinia calthae TaxID=38488 RepID=A0A4Y8D5J4_9HELO|nr:hypothetical protein BOTCAL_0143g00130 [Botryotinia calthae]